MSVLFMLFNHTGEIGFPFSDVVLSYKQYAYSMMEHLIRVVLAVALLVGATQYRFALKVFVAIECVEVLDFMLTWGEPWFDNKILTWNTLKVGIFGTAILYEKYGR